MLIAPGLMSMLECRGTAPPPTRALLLCQTSWNYQLEFGGCFASTKSLSCTMRNDQKFNGICVEKFAGVQIIQCWKKNHISWQERMDFTPILMPSILVHSRLRQRGYSSSISTRSLAQVLRQCLGIWGFLKCFLHIYVAKALLQLHTEHINMQKIPTAHRFLQGIIFLGKEGNAGVQSWNLCLRPSKAEWQTQQK